MGPQNCRNEKVNIATLNCLYTNADQLNNKFNELELIVKSNNLDIIMITEVKPKNPRFTPRPGEYKLEGYDMYHVNIDTNVGRGCLFYVKLGLEVKEISVSNTFDEYILIEISCKNDKKIAIGCIYRSPNSSIYNNEKLNMMISEISNKNYINIILLGDFNYSQINWDNQQMSERCNVVLAMNGCTYLVPMLVSRNINC